MNVFLRKKIKAKETELLEILLPEKCRNFRKIKEIFQKSLKHIYLLHYKKMFNTVSMKCMWENKNTLILI